jgi:GST-like protein
MPGSDSFGCCFHCRIALDFPIDSTFNARAGRGSRMITLYSFGTPNGHKISIALEEMGLEYTLVPTDIRVGEQRTPEMLALNPNAKIPIITDDDGPGGKPFTLWESGAILIYLAEKAGSSLLSSDPVHRLHTLQWLFFQVGSIGPMFGQLGHFVMHAPETMEYPLDRYRREVLRLYDLLDQRLGQSPYLVDSGYSIADIAHYGWVGAATRYAPIANLDRWPNVARWHAQLAARPAVQRGINAPPRGH